MKNIVILGSTGSIGRQTLDVVRAFPDEFRVLGLAAGNNAGLLAEQVREFPPPIRLVDLSPAGRARRCFLYWRWRRWSAWKRPTW